MKLFIIFLFSTSILCAQTKDEERYKLNCLVLKTFLQEPVLYKVIRKMPNSSEGIKVLFSGISDTLTILDKDRAFYDCEIDTIKGKKIILIDSDFIPFPITGGQGIWHNICPESTKKYNCYFVIEEPIKKRNSITIKFFQIFHNRSGFFTYKIKKQNLILEKYLIE